jgi:hypothetical protein
MFIQLVSFAFGLLLGSILLLASVHNFIKYRTFGLGGSVLTVFGTMLVGLSLWSQFEITIDQGKLSARYILSQELGQRAAQVNNQIAEIRKKLDYHEQDIAVIRQAIPAASVPPEQSQQRKEKELLFQRNSTYSVLVFSKPDQMATASSIAKNLIASGFQSSATSTDLTESKKQLRPQQAWVIHTERGAERLDDIVEKLKAAAPEISFVVEHKPSSLMQGDIQVLLF